MSLSTGLQALNLEMPDHIPHTEYISHRPFIMKLTGLDPEEPAQSEKALSALAKALDYDFIWSTYSRDWGLPKTEMGRAKYYETEIPYESIYPFKSVEDVLNFRPLERANIPSMDELTLSVTDYYKQGILNYPDAVFPGGFYNSIFTWNIVTFGWDLFLLAAKDDPKRFDIVLDQFAALSMMIVEAHIKANIPVFLSHDDIVWASGPVFSPQWMREKIFPRLKKLWQPLKDAGIKIIFCSDGNFDYFLDDIINCGADGLIIEPLTDLKSIVDRYGNTHVIIGNIDSRILQFGKFNEIEQEVIRCANLGKSCPGYFFAVGNHIPYTVPIPNVECYLDAIHKHGKR
jgi:hypothetical protein